MLPPSEAPGERNSKEAPSPAVPPRSRNGELAKRLCGDGERPRPASKELPMARGVPGLARKGEASLRRPGSGERARAMPGNFEPGKAEVPPTSRILGAEAAAMACAMEAE
mmetsp:Transcript_159270/g.511007  ORF Transcript_159270/g.511007 Transcript_159270/m.511007 type:complete len:110 (+) Transcript_159270:1317-1646(+)